MSRRQRFWVAVTEPRISWVGFSVGMVVFSIVISVWPR